MANMTTAEPTAEKHDYSQTYWNGKGKHQSLAAQLEKLIPMMGECPADRPKLESLRKAQNLYYDLYNNGGCNHPSKAFAKLGVQKTAFNSRDARVANHQYKTADEKMDKFILAAAKEAGLTE